VTFASFLLLWGGVVDLYPAKTVFTSAFVAVGIANLILSFLTDRFAFFVVRALQGIAAAALVPSAYRLISCTFPPAERQKAYTLYGMTGSIANVSGTIIAGVIDLIPNGGQMRSWRWFFRIVSVVSSVLLPSPRSYLVLKLEQTVRCSLGLLCDPARQNQGQREKGRLEAARLCRNVLVSSKPFTAFRH
jgi:MFS family permease